LVDTQDLKSCGFTAVRVRFPSWVQINSIEKQWEKVIKDPKKEN